VHQEGVPARPGSLKPSSGSKFKKLKKKEKKKLKH
jgi:hypothetical protein